MEDKLIIVDKNNNVIGYEDKEKCHFGNGILHQAFLVMIFNDKNELLITKRSELKKLWPSFWDGSVASHVHKNETCEEATKRRLKEEIGIHCNNIKILFKFKYNSQYKNVGSENEICAILTAKCDGNISVNAKEISDWKFINLDELKKDIKNNSGKYTPWFLITLEKYLR